MPEWFSPLPLLTPGDDGGRSRKALSRAFSAGDLVRVRHGFYVDTTTWLGATAAERFTTIVKAVAVRLHQPIFTGVTALILHGLPVAHTPATVDVVTTSASRSGLQTTMPGYHDAHLRHAGELPYIHRTRNAYRDRLPQTAEPQFPALGTALRTVGLKEDLTSLLCGMDFSDALMVADSLLSGQNPNSIRWTRLELEQVIREASAAQGSHLTHLLRHATDLSESPGESLSRARMIELGFALPRLQATLTGANGVDYRVDFWWEELGLIGESDGWAKYSLHGAAPEESIRREKRREDALRERGYRFLRWDWADAVDPQRFAELLVRNRVPRRRRASIRWAA